MVIRRGQQHSGICVLSSFCFFSESQPATISAMRLIENRNEIGGFPAVRSVDDAGVGANLPGGHCCALQWDDLTWLSSLTPMKLVVKGVMTAEDASLCAVSSKFLVAVDSMCRAR